MDGSTILAEARQIYPDGKPCKTWAEWDALDALKQAQFEHCVAIALKMVEASSGKPQAVRVRDIADKLVEMSERSYEAWIVGRGLAAQPDRTRGDC